MIFLILTIFLITGNKNIAVCSTGHDFRYTEVPFYVKCSELTQENTPDRRFARPKTDFETVQFRFVLRPRATIISRNFPPD